MYKYWKETLETFKEATKQATFSDNGLVIKPNDGALENVEIKSTVSNNDKLHIFVNREQAKFIIDSLKRIYEL
jgi:hypothetical protein